MTRIQCPLDDDEVRSLACLSDGPVQVLAQRVADARAREHDHENRYCGVSWPQRRAEEAPGPYLERAAAAALQREQRGAGTGMHSGLARAFGKAQGRIDAWQRGNRVEPDAEFSVWRERAEE